jgi:class 3 adenylate cyclase
VADAYEWATVLFVDLVDSTPLATRLSPTQLVALLDKVFSALDTLAVEHGLTKIKTGGDSWLAVSGVPEPRPDHAEAAADVALKAREAVAAAGREAGIATPLQVRIGIHSGPLVAGVVGTRVPAFDLWGQTVAIASRMESHGLPGRIQVSLATAQCLMPRYRMRMRGTLEIKGVGEMAAYLLEGRTSDAPISPEPAPATRR